MAHYVLDEALALGCADRDIASVRELLAKLSTQEVTTT
jgi:hypothetical protein